MKTRTYEEEIENAKIILDGARSIRDRYPTAENGRVVAKCEDDLNDLLDRYPRENRN